VNAVLQQNKKPQSLYTVEWRSVYEATSDASRNKHTKEQAKTTKKSTPETAE
jgi:hypothetical protein